MCVCSAQHSMHVGNTYKYVNDCTYTHTYMWYTYYYISNIYLNTFLSLNVVMEKLLWSIFLRSVKPSPSGMMLRAFYKTHRETFMVSVYKCLNTHMCTLIIALCIHAWMGTTMDNIYMDRKRAYKMYYK